MLDLSTLVFSCRGSYLTVFAMHPDANNNNRGKRVDKNTGQVISDDRLEPGFYMRNCFHRRDYQNNLFSIQPEGTSFGECPPYLCEPEKLTIGNTNPVEICFASPGTLLMRTERAVKIQCRKLRGRHTQNGNAFHIADDERHYSLAFYVLHGQAEWNVTEEAFTLKLLPGSLLQVDEAWDDAGAPAPTDDFDHCVVRRKKDFESFCLRLPTPIPGDEALMKQAAYILWSLIAAPRGNIRRECVLVSKDYMCGIWADDHCWAANAMAVVYPELAWDQWMMQFDHQRENGQIPDCIQPTKFEWNFIKPPVHGLMLDLLETRLKLTPEQHREAYRVLSRLTNWWMTERNPFGHELACYRHGNDSGCDNASCFDDEKWKDGWFESADLQTFLVRQMHTLARLANTLGMREEAQEWIDQANKLRDRTLNELFINGEPIARAARTGERTGARSLVPYQAALLGEDLPSNAKHKILSALTSAQFSTPYGLVLEALDSPYFQRDGFFRGSIWGYTEMKITLGLKAMGEDKLARREMERYVAACRKSGFRECYEASTGNGQRAGYFMQSTCTYLLFTDMLNHK